MRSSENDVLFRPLREEEITRALFLHFCRRQRVTNCLRNVGGEWLEVFSPFTDDWNEEDYARLQNACEAPCKRAARCSARFRAVGSKGSLRSRASLSALRARTES